MTVLVEKLASKAAGHEIYFWKWTDIGPAGTKHLDLAARFGSAEEARQSPAFTHFLSFYEPLELERASERDDRF